MQNTVVTRRWAVLCSTGVGAKTAFSYLCLCPLILYSHYWLLVYPYYNLCMCVQNQKYNILIFLFLKRSSPASIWIVPLYLPPPCLDMSQYEGVKGLPPGVEHVEEPARVVGHEHGVGGEVDQRLARGCLVADKDGRIQPWIRSVSFLDGEHKE